MQGRPNLEEFINLIAEQSSLSSKTISRLLNIVYNIILKQLELNGVIAIPNFGIFTIEERKEKTKLIPDPARKGEMKLTYIKPKNIIKFKPSTVFDFCVNEGDFEYDNYSENKAKKKISKKRKSQRKALESGYTYKNNYVDLVNFANKNKKGTDE